MKKLLLATAVAALSVSAAHAAPTVYGKAFLTADYLAGSDAEYKATSTYYPTVGNPVSETYTEKEDGESNTQLNSNSSRIGLKGGEPLTANTDLVYQLEYGVDIDENSPQFKSRDTYLGLANKQYGTLVAGRLSAIDDNINYANQAVGQFDNSFGGAAWDGNRVNNSMAYFSPQYNGLQFMAMYGLDGDEDAGGLQDGGFGVGLKYEPAAQPFRAGATYIGSGDFNTVRLSGAYDLNSQFGLGALYQITDNNDGAVIGEDEDGDALLWGNDKENVFSISGTMKTATPWTAYAQADIISNVAGYDGADSQQFVVGGKYAFTKATTGHLYAGYRNNEFEATTEETVPGGRVVTTESYKQDGFGIGAGLEHKF